MCYLKKSIKHYSYLITIEEKGGLYRRKNSDVKFFYISLQFLKFHFLNVQKYARTVSY